LTVFKKIILFPLLFACILAGCSSPPPAGPRSLTVMAHDSFAVSPDVLEAFEADQNAKVEVLLAGDAGSALNQAVLSKGAPLADVFYGVDNSFLSRALEESIFEPYESPLLAEIPDAFELDAEHRALPVDYGDVCLNYEIAYFEENGLPVPASLEDLLKPEYRGLLTVENPATSSPGLAFLFTTIAQIGEDGYLDYWQGLLDNEVEIVNDWETAYYTAFSQWGGPDPLVVSYGSSPPFEVLFAESPIETPPTAAITADGTCFRQIEFVGILDGTPNRDLAEAWVDFMLSPTFQEDIPLQMFVFPVNQDATLDPAFVDFLAIPAKPASLDPALIAEMRDTGLQDWTEAILR
jgi:thiamine transport system substrate-binding protein